MKFQPSAFAFLTAVLASSTGPQQAFAANITYGENIYIQNYNVASTWVLRQGPNNDYPNLPLVNVIAHEDQVGLANFAFVSNSPQFDRYAQDPTKDDPEYGQCVKYGDEIYIWNTLYTGGLDSFFWQLDGNGNVYQNFGGDLFTLRSNQGNGLTNSAQNPDPLIGQCVQDDAVVYIQQLVQNGLWVGMLNNDLVAGYLGVPTTSASVVSQQVQNPMWILSSTLSDGSTSYGVACPGVPSSTTGHWQIVQGSGGSSGQKITITTGTTTTTSSSITKTQSWQNSITATATAGFSFAGASAGLSVAVSGQEGQTQSSSISQAVALTQTVSSEQDFPAGQVWQFVYGTADTCDMNGFQILVEEFTLTSGADQYPCCLPGLFADESNPHGPCKAGTPCACSADICAGTRRGLRGNSAI